MVTAAEMRVSIQRAITEACAPLKKEITRLRRRLAKKDDGAADAEELPECCSSESDDELVDASKRAGDEADATAALPTKRGKGQKVQK